MESRILGTLGRIGGLGGIALGVFVLIFRGVLEKQLLPQAGLTAGQAFAVILSLMILTFGIAGIGVIAWLIGRSETPRAPVSMAGIGIVAGLTLVVLGAAIYVGARPQRPLQAEPVVPLNPAVQSTPTISATGGGVVIGRDAIGTTINTAPIISTPATPAK